MARILLCEGWIARLSTSLRAVSPSTLPFGLELRAERLRTVSLSNGLSNGYAARALSAVCIACACVLLAGCSSVPLERQAVEPVSARQVGRPSYRPFVYYVRAGDTLYSLGERFRVPWREIAEDNDIGEPGALRVGMVLFIPRVEGVEPPELAAPTSPRTGAAPRKPVSPSALHRGEPSSSFWWPTSGRIARHYGDTVRAFPEPGIAIAAPAGTEVCAVAAGTVVTRVDAGRTAESVWGNVVAVAHAGGMVSWCAHLDQILVQKGRKVSKGEPIGTVGSTGAAVSPHLAFRLFRNERPVNPEQYLP